MTLEKTKQISQLGIASLLGFVATQALRDVYLGQLFGDLGLFEVAALAFGSAALVFGAFLLITRPRELSLLASGWRTVLLLNATTAAAWLSYFEALRLAQPAAVNLAFCGIAPIAVTLFAKLGLRSTGEHQIVRAALGVHIGLLATVAALFAVAAPLGIALAAIAGVAITAETILAKRMNESGVSALAIVGTRFVFVTAIAVGMLTRTAHPYAGMDAAALALQAAIFLAILIGPIYLAQAGIALTSPMVAGVICALGPVATLGLQSLAGGMALDAGMIAITLTYTVLAMVAAGLAAARPSPAGETAAGKTSDEAVPQPPVA
jgi:drug/metabolite transporter (DMT)-like permease